MNTIENDLEFFMQLKIVREYATNVINELELDKKHLNNTTNNKMIKLLDDFLDVSYDLKEELKKDL